MFGGSGPSTTQMCVAYIPHQNGLTNVLTQINIIAGGQAATAWYRVHQVFTYKGVENDDVASICLTFEKGGRGPHGWTVVGGSRSTGMKPADAPPKTFNA